MNFQKLKNKEDIILYESEMFDASYEKLPAGLYTLSDVGGMFKSVPSFALLSEGESLIEFNDGILAQIFYEIDQFFTDKTKAAYKEMDIVYKIGYILYGIPGTGKTCLATLAMRKLAEKYDAICLDATKTNIGFVKSTIKRLREFQQNPIVVFFDECDDHLAHHESYFLPFLDGNESVPGTIFLGCTNKINNISDRIKNRKSRIKKCFEIKSLPVAVYTQYLSTKLPKLDKKIIAEFAYKAEEKKLNIDQFKNAILDYKLYSLSLDDAIHSAMETYGKSKSEDDENNKGGGWYGGFNVVFPKFLGKK
jgi:hypothetical protein